MPTHAPSSTPSHTPGNPPRAILEPSVLKDISIYYAYSAYTESVKSGKAEEMSEIWRIQADGSGKQRLLRGDVLERNWLANFGSLRLSHAGRKLAFVQGVELFQTTIRSSSLWTMDTDGANARQWVGRFAGNARPGSAASTDQDQAVLTGEPRPDSPVWSSDDAEIAFVDETDPSFGQVYVLDLKSGQWRRVSAGDVVDWSPDSRSLAVRSNPPAADMIALQVVDTNGRVQATVQLPSGIVLRELYWSGSTGRIAALALRLYTENYDICVIDPYKGITEGVVKDVFVYTPRWSPDGKMILFARGGQFIRDLYVLDLASRRERLIMQQVGYLGIWSADNRFVLTQSDLEGNELYIVSVSDGQYWKIPNADGEIEGTWFSSYDWLFPSP